jgi:hypothetical protein
MSTLIDLAGRDRHVLRFRVQKLEMYVLREPSPQPREV